MMHNNSKYLLIGTVLLAASGTALAFNGSENCNQRGAWMQGEQGMHSMDWQHKKHQHKNRGHQKKAKHSYLRSIYQLQDLTPEQRSQLDEIRQAQRAIMRNQRAEMKQKVEAILTQPQREALGKYVNPDI